MVWGFFYLRIFKNLHSISGRSLGAPIRYLEFMTDLTNVH
jgi:hypothetical protein